MPRGKDTRHDPVRKVGPKTATGGGNNKPPKTPKTKTGGYGAEEGGNEEPPKYRKPFTYQESPEEARENRYNNGWYN
jgi:hypothetical protein